MKNPLRASILFTCLLCLSQMPDWRFFQDGDGNRYYVDSIGRIRTAGDPEFIYKTITVRGLEYYSSQAEELIRRHHPLEGLLILKTILAMHPDDQRIIDAQGRASKSLNFLKRREGDRYEVLDRNASLLIFESAKKTHVVNDFMFYSITSAGTVKVLRNRWRLKNSYWYNGVTLGVRKQRSDGKDKDEGHYDFLVAIDAEKFARPVILIEHLEKQWDERLMFDNVKKREISRTAEQIVSSFTSGGDDGFAGYESFVKNGSCGYLVRIITPASRLEANDEFMRSLVSEFAVSGVR
jgi:hypothetical protein